MVEAVNRCQICYSPHAEDNTLRGHQRTSFTFEIPQTLTVICTKCFEAFLSLGRIKMRAGFDHVLYDPDKFEREDRTTWLQIDAGRIHIQWAEDFELEAWSDYCPICGCTALDKTRDPYIQCMGCGGMPDSDEVNRINPEDLEKDPVSDPDLVDLGVEDDEQYQRYLDGEVWEVLACKVKARDGGRCMVCDRSSNLCVHHRTYIRIYQERLKDLVTLCQPCHELFHFARELWK